MLKTYFKVGWHNFTRNRIYSIINVGGLATGMAVAIFIGLWFLDEMNFNRTFANYSRIAEVYQHFTFGEVIHTDGVAPYPMGNELRANYADFERVAIATEQQEHIIQHDDDKFSRTGLFVDPQFTEIFSIPMQEGTTTSLNEIHSILISRSFAVALGGGQSLGKMIRFDNRENLVITGVFEDFPVNSEFAGVELLIPISYYFTLSEAKNNQRNSWEDFGFQCFVQLTPMASWETTNAKIQNVCFEKGSADLKSVKPESFLFPMSKWHLYSEFKDGKSTGGQIRFVRMFGVVAVIVLLLACINFMSLSTARSEKRSREIGIRKVMGSLRRQLVTQFLTEALLVTIVAFVVALGFVFTFMPWFNDLTGKSMTVPWNNIYYFGASLVFVLLTSAMAGSYPAFYLSSFNPVMALKGTFKAGKNAKLPRKLLVVFQFTVSTVLLIGTIVVYQQIQHAKDRPAGFDRDGIIHLSVRTEDLAKADYNSLRTDLLATGLVENMAISDFPITGNSSADASLTWEGKDPAYRPLIAMNRCSHDFPATNGFKFVAGRDFSREFSTDTLAIIVNEMMAKLLGDGDVLGKKIASASGKQREVIGVIKDQVRWTPFSKQSPHIYLISYEGSGTLTIRLKSGERVQRALEEVEAVLEKYDHSAPFDYRFVDEDYARLFTHEERTGKLAGVFALLTILISCLGIFGLAAFSASQRKKEIGIRKVLGASIYRVWRMLTTDFVLLVIVAILLACPMAYYLSNEWLQHYDYRIELSFWYFFITALAATGITIVAVSYQSVMAAIVNPVECLNAE